MRGKKFDFEGVVFDLETQELKRDDSYPLMSIAVTWDKKKKFCIWNEGEVVDLFKYLSRFPYIVGSNLTNFDYQVLENYLPYVRSKLGRKTIDILAHARWGYVLNSLEQNLSLLHIMFEGELGEAYFNQLKSNLMIYGLTLDKQLQIVADNRYKHSFRGEIGISLGNLSWKTLGKKKAGKGKSAPKLYQSENFKELIRYCKQDVLLTRDVFIYGIRNGYVKNSGFQSNLPVWWRELAEYLSNKPIKGKSSKVEADNFAWQIARLSKPIASAFSIGSYVLNWEGVAHKVISLYNPFGSYPDRKKKMEILAAMDEIGE